MGNFLAFPSPVSSEGIAQNVFGSTCPTLQYTIFPFSITPTPTISVSDTCKVADLTANTDIETIISSEPADNMMPLVDTSTTGDNTAPTPYDPVADMYTPEWLKHWRRNHGPQSWTPSPTWGFVIFRTALYTDEPSWQTFKTEITRVINLSFAREREFEQERLREDPTASPLPADYEPMASQLELRWIEDSTLADAPASTLRTRYNTDLKPSLPAGLANPVFLVATPDVTTSILSLTPDKHPHAKAKYWRRRAPYFIAVDADYDANTDAQFNDEYDSFMRVKPCFKVVAESVASELWTAVNDDARPLWHRTLAVRAAEEIEEVPPQVNQAPFLEDLWWSAGPTPASIRRRRPWLYEGQPEVEDDDDE